MLHCYKKSRHNLYEQLDYLGLNPYEQRHFCFEGAGSGEGGEGGGFGGMEDAAGAEDNTGIDAVGPGPADTGEDEDSIGGYEAFDIGTVEQYEAVDAAEQASRAQTAALSQTQRDEASRSLMSARTTQEGIDEIQSAMDLGLIGYNESVDLGYFDLIDKADRDWGLNLAKDLQGFYDKAGKDVTIGWTQEEGISYNGPDAFSVAAAEMGKGLGSFAQLMADSIMSLPTPMSLAMGAIMGKGHPMGVAMGNLFKNKEDRVDLQKNADDFYAKKSLPENVATILGLPNYLNPQIYDKKSQVDAKNSQVNLDYTKSNERDINYNPSVVGVDTYKDIYQDMINDGDDRIPFLPKIPTKAVTEVEETPFMPIAKTPQPPKKDIMAILEGIYGRPRAEELLGTV